MNLSMTYFSVNENVTLLEVYYEYVILLEVVYSETYYNCCVKIRVRFSCNEYSENDLFNNSKRYKFCPIILFQLPVIRLTIASPSVNHGQDAKSQSFTIFQKIVLRKRFLTSCWIRSFEENTTVESWITERTGTIDRILSSRSKANLRSCRPGTWSR